MSMTIKLPEWVGGTITTIDGTLIWRNGRLFITEETRGASGSLTRREIDVTEEVKKALR